MSIRQRWREESTGEKIRLVVLLLIFGPLLLAGVAWGVLVLVGVTVVGGGFYVEALQRVRLSYVGINLIRYLAIVVAVWLAFFVGRFISDDQFVSFDMPLWAAQLLANAAALIVVGIVAGPLLYNSRDTEGDLTGFVSKVLLILLPGLAGINHAFAQTRAEPKRQASSDAKNAALDRELAEIERKHLATILSRRSLEQPYPEGLTRRHCCLCDSLDLAVIEDFDGFDYSVECLTCGVRGPRADYPEIAIAMWNEPLPRP